MTKSKELREKYIKYFKTLNHREIKGASLVPENDPSVLFTTAGMHPLVPYLLGEKHPTGNRLVNYQKCLRTGDIDEVGDKVHLTFFEMLGNWSLNEYFKEESIKYSYEFLTKELGFNHNRLAVTVFSGDEDAPFDETSYNAWLELGIAPERIAKLDKEENWWPAGGKHTGPQGPDTEIFYFISDEEPPKKYNPEDKRWVEIWNNVFMEYNKTSNGNFESLGRHNVDTGMGLERMTIILENKDNIYETSLFESIMNIIKSNSNNTNERSERIIADHMRASTFVIADGVTPSNVDQGYILRRLLRRSIRHMTKIEYNLEALPTLIDTIINTLNDIYPYLDNKKEFIINTIIEEKDKFMKTLEKGEKRLNKIIESYKAQNINTINGKAVFNLYDTYGFPPQITEEIAKENGMEIDMEKYEELFNEHQEKSRTAAAGKFKGGLADDGTDTVKLHTAAHLLHQALKNVLGDHVEQKGANITAERLRFDFSHNEKLTDEELKEVEKLVNEQIDKAIPVEMKEVSKDDALKEGAHGLFTDKYGDIVKVYTIGDFSKEICGGPHVENTKELGSFKILKEKSSAAGVRRIKAILE